jgi:hypothetical protein
LLRTTGREVESLTWYLAAGQPETCSRARNRVEIQNGMTAGARDETPEYWTLIEAVLLAGACPDRLDDLYANVTALGYPDAARAVDQYIDQALKA